MNKYILESFKEKYGHNVFNKIKESIKNEVKNSKLSIVIDDNYLLYIFEIAILEKCEVEDDKIVNIIKRMGNEYIPEISLSEIQKIHIDSIKLIKSYI